ncbi:hypothetical protein [Epilithonimonas hominis]|nr:hypothetical protein [Epilithonimonas hominis]
MENILKEIEVIEWQLTFARDPVIIRKRKERLKELQEELEKLTNK